MIFYTIYEVTNTLNGKKYRGVHKTKNQYDSYKGSGNLLKKAIKKYKSKNFSKVVLACALDEESMYWLEKNVFVTDDWVSSENTYNQTVGGAGMTGKGVEYGYTKRNKTMNLRYGCDHPIQNSAIRTKMMNTCMEKYGAYNYFQSTEGKELAKKLNSGENNPSYGRTVSETHKNIIGKTHKERWVKMSQCERNAYIENIRKKCVRFIYILTSPDELVYYTDSLPIFCEKMKLSYNAFKNEIRRSKSENIVVPPYDKRFQPSDERMNTDGWKLERKNKSDVDEKVLMNLVVFK